jgi:hypothetical protein
LVTEVEGKESGLPANCVELFQGLTAKVSVPACDNDELCRIASDCLGRFEAKTGIAAGDDYGLRHLKTLEK